MNDRFEIHVDTSNLPSDKKECYIMYKSGISEDYPKATSNCVKIKINAEFIHEFHSYQEFEETAFMYIKDPPPGIYSCTRLLLWVDKNENACSYGMDFIHARDNNLFPIKLYRLIKSREL
jgi:hypothetical protein